MKTKAFKISIKKAGKFYWKPVEVPHWESMSRLSSRKQDVYYSANGIVPRTVQVFWLWFYVQIDLQTKFMSGFLVKKIDVKELSQDYKTKFINDFKK